MKVLGISALFHDSAAALISDGQLVAAIEEERISRRKHDGGVPWRAARACLEIGGMRISELECIAYYEDPAAKMDRQLSMLSGETRADVAASLLRRMDPGQVHTALREELGYDGPVTYVPHHLSHAASSYYLSGFDEAAVLIVDAVGEWSTSSRGSASARSGIQLQEVDRFPHSLGLFYSMVTAYLGFEVNDGEYKTMGLAPTGKPALTAELERVISWAEEDGQVTLDLRYFDFLGLRRMWTPAFTELIGRPPRAPGAELSEWHADLARSAQDVLERVCLAKAKTLTSRAAPRNLCMAGGVALNCVMTAALRETGRFSDIFVQPAAGDAGGALGAAAHVAAMSGDGLPLSRLEHVYLGQSFSDQDVISLLRSCAISFADYRSSFSILADDIAGRLSRGQIIGWFQGRAEFGPRALGNRSILADPRVGDMRDRLNERIKMREKFRPFAPAVLASAAADYFRCPVPLPFMLETVQVRTDALPSVTHVDGSARVQTVSERANPRFASLLSRFGQLTGCPVLLNTSFNQRGEPIVNSPEDALACFVRSRLDALVLGDFVVDRQDIPRSWHARQAAPQSADRSDQREVGVYELV